MTKATTTKKAVTKKTTTKKTVAKTTTTKTKKKGLSLAAQASKRAQVHRNRSAGSKKGIKKLKAAKKGLFAPKTLSAALAAICGSKKLSNVEVTKAIWKYIKAKKLNDGRIIKPDEKMKAVFPVAKLDMLKMGSYVKKHVS
jgi:chromatin remodeling complex protein RSC6